jgi:hypothetical protein
MRWQVEVTYEEARRHLGLETQRQWSDKAIARITPALLGLFAWITLVAQGFTYLVSRSSFVSRLGTLNPCLPFRMRRHWCGISFGLPYRLFKHRRGPPTC